MPEEKTDRFTGSKLAAIFFGSHARYSMEHRFLNGALVFGALTALSSLVFNIVLHLGLYLQLLTGLTFILCVVLYYFTRFRDKFLVPLYTVSVAILIMLSFLWLANAGSDGPVIYIYFAILTFFIFMHTGRAMAIMVGLLILNLIVLSCIERWLPGLVIPYDNPSVRVLDHYSVLLPTILVIVLVVSYARMNLMEEKRKAQISDQLKSAFLANMSHEIRTPMNSILGFSQLLEDEQINGKTRKQYLDYIHSSGESLLHLINDIIDISKIEAGELKVSESDFNLADLLKELQATFEGGKRKMGKEALQLILELPVYADSYCYRTDPFRLKQILLNLLGNAFKYTDTGSVSFGYKEDPKDLVFYVKDTGIGMSSEQTTRIFERFRKIEDRVDRLYSGTGLGLSISKNLIELLGGKIWVASEVGQGTTFWFTIPLKKQPGHSTGTVEESVKAQFEWQENTILVVEDDPVNFAYFRNVIGSTGAKVIWAENGQVAIGLVEKNPGIDLVLMDIRLPLVSGVEAMQSLKMVNTHLPVIALTSYAMAGEKEKFLKLGFNGYLSKPVRGSQIVETIAGFIH